MDIDIDRLIAKLREVKQREFNRMVEGDGRQPADVVDAVVMTLHDLTGDPRLFSEVIDFYPDYTG